METLYIEIKIGNSAMLTPYDIAKALRETADKIMNGSTLGNIHDANGNNVGSYLIDADDLDNEEE